MRSVREWRKSRQAGVYFIKRAWVRAASSAQTLMEDPLEARSALGAGCE